VDGIRENHEEEKVEEDQMFDVPLRRRAVEVLSLLPSSRLHKTSVPGPAQKLREPSMKSRNVVGQMVQRIPDLGNELCFS
jgi:hypothetical protein